MELSKVTRRTFIAGALVASARPINLMAQDAAVKIGVGSDPVYASFFLASHEKMFEAAKLNVAIKIFSDGGEALNNLVAKQVDLAAGSEPSNMLRFARAEIRPIAICYQSGRYIKFVLRKEIDSPEKIKKVGIVPGSVSEYTMLLALKKLGLDQSAVQMVRSGPPEFPALLARGDIDAYFAWEPWPTMGIKQGGRVIMNSNDVGYPDAMWVTAAAGFLDTNADTAKAILKVLARSCEIVAREPERAAAAVQAVTKMPVAQTLAVLKEFDAGVRDFNDKDFEIYDGIAGFLAQQKLTSTLVDFRHFIQRGFYKADPK